MTSNALENVFTADHAWARLVVEEVRRKVDEPSKMRALGYCVGIHHAEFMARSVQRARVSRQSRLPPPADEQERIAALRDLAAGEVRVVFTVDLFNEGIDLPDVDTLLMLRPTESPTLFLQQLGRGLRKAPEKTVCTVLDFVGTHRKEFRFDRRLRASSAARASMWNVRSKTNSRSCRLAAASIWTPLPATSCFGASATPSQPGGRPLRGTALARGCGAGLVPREQWPRA